MWIQWNPRHIAGAFAPDEYGTRGAVRRSSYSRKLFEIAVASCNSKVFINGLCASEVDSKSIHLDDYRKGGGCYGI